MTIGAGTTGAIRTNLSEPTTSDATGLWLGSIIFLLAFSAIGRLVWEHYVRRRVSQKAVSTIAQLAKSHASALVRRRAQLVQADAYGKLKFEKWFAELEYFITEHILPHLSPRELEVLAKNRFDIKAAIVLFVDQETQNNPAYKAFSDDMTPSEFETFCAEELKRVGWNARVTMQSRDQGVDVIAEKNGVRIVLQCKLYARPVGNKSVQEAAAARVHEQADYGIVVSNNRYTRDAEQLASTNKILLLHYTDLTNLEDIIERSWPIGDDWYYNDGDKQEGPLTLQELRNMLATAKSPGDVLVWCDAFSDWERVKHVKELHA
jgi:restriction system protein